MFLALPPDPPLATLTVAPLADAEAWALSADGSTVVGVARGAAFAWRLPALGESGVGRGTLLAASSLATSVSGDGRLVGGFATEQVTAEADGHRWIGGIPNVPMPQSPQLKSTWGGILGVSGTGEIVVGDAILRYESRTRNSATRIQGIGEAAAWRWTTEGAPRSLGAGWGSRATAISRDGRTIVGAIPSPGQGFRWNAEDGLVSIGDLPGGAADTHPRAVSADGTIIVGRARSKAGREAFRWAEAEGPIGLGDLPGRSFSSEARGTTEDGRFVVGSSEGDAVGESRAGSRAFHWRERGGMQDLHSLLLVQGRAGAGLPPRFEAWRLEAAIGIRALGEGRLRAAGTARDEKGRRVAFVATFAEGP